MGENTALYYGREVNQRVENLDNNKDAIDQLDTVDNASFELIKTLVETTGEDIDWDISIISEVNESVIQILRSRGYRVWYPCSEDE